MLKLRSFPVVCAALLFSTGPASATTEIMKQARAKDARVQTCSSCHVNPQPTKGDAALNASGAAWRPAPAVDTDLRIQVDSSLLTQAAANLAGYTLGGFIQLGELHPICGCDPTRSPFSLAALPGVNLSLSPWTDADDLPGLNLSLHLPLSSHLGNDQFDCPGGGDLTIDLATTASTVRRAVPIKASVAGVLSAAVCPNWHLAFHHVLLPFTLPVPAIPAAIPVTLTDSNATTFEFGAGTLSHWTSAPNPHSKAVPVVVRVSMSNQWLLFDGTIGSERRRPPAPGVFAKMYMDADMPVGAARNANLGATLRESFFGAVRPGETGTGLLGQLLPIRVRTTIPDRKLLGIFHTKDQKLEVVLSAGAVSLKEDPTNPSAEVELQATEATLNGRPLIANKGAVLGSVRGRVVFDRLSIANGAMTLRVADFRVVLRKWLFILPVALSSGQLQHSLNDGILTIARPAGWTMELPRSVAGLPTKFQDARLVFGHLGYVEGNRVIHLTLDPKTMGVRLQDLSGNPPRRGWQVAARAAATAAPN
ncbi:MAG: hypothetical protein ACM3JH_00570 [Acidithiobacillales bacterium]